MTAVRMFQFQMHTGFLDADTTCFQLERYTKINIVMLYVYTVIAVYILYNN